MKDGCKTKIHYTYPHLTASRLTKLGRLSRLLCNVNQLISGYIVSLIQVPPANAIRIAISRRLGHDRNLKYTSRAGCGDVLRDYPQLAIIAEHAGSDTWR
jgi:hypothetical protein